MTSTYDNQWYRNLLERNLRNLLQALAPILVLAQTDGTLPDFQPVGLALFSVVVLTSLKFFAGLTSNATAPLLYRLLDRVGSAGAAAVLAYIPATWSGSLGEVNWYGALISAVASVLMSLIMMYGMPPANDDDIEEIGNESGIHGEPGGAD